jgi:hypothetical protein
MLLSSRKRVTVVEESILLFIIVFGRKLVVEYYNPAMSMTLILPPRPVFQPIILKKSLTTTEVHNNGNKPPTNQLQEMVLTIMKVD